MKKILFTIIIVCLSLALFGCSLSSQIFMEKYMDSDKYLIGSQDYTGDLNRIDIIWYRGKVNLVEDSNLETIKVVEENDLEDRLKVHSFFENGVLHIRYWQSELNFFLKDAKNDKELTVYFPSVNSITSVMTSTDLYSENIKTNDIYIVSTTGNIEINTLESNQTVLVSTSGKITINNLTSDDVSASTTSGDIKLDNIKTNNISILSTSGNTDLNILELTNKINISATSGNSTVNMNNIGFTLSFSKTSGKLKTDLEYETVEKKYVFGDGLIEFNCIKTSGNLTIK